NTEPLASSTPPQQSSTQQQQDTQLASAHEEVSNSSPTIATRVAQQATSSLHGSPVITAHTSGNLTLHDFINGYDEADEEDIYDDDYEYYDYNDDDEEDYDEDEEEIDDINDDNESDSFNDDQEFSDFDDFQNDDLAYDNVEDRDSMLDRLTSPYIPSFLNIRARTKKARLIVGWQ
ncbi:MAG: hypothetical protein EZS28_052907, partial [Streblomastix strix]